jgi:putative ABC transport system substrate-binding protein
VTNINTELAPKRLELLRELIPTAKLIAVLVNPTSTFIAENITKDLQSTARTLGLQLKILNASTERDFDTVFATLAQLRADALVIAPDAMFISRSEQLGALTLRHAVPAASTPKGTQG